MFILIFWLSIDYCSISARPSLLCFSLRSFDQYTISILELYCTSCTPQWIRDRYTLLFPMAERSIHSRFRYRISEHTSYTSSSSRWLLDSDCIACCENRQIANFLVSSSDQRMQAVHINNSTDESLGGPSALE